MGYLILTKFAEILWRMAVLVLFNVFIKATDRHFYLNGIPDVTKIYYFVYPVVA